MDGGHLPIMPLCVCDILLMLFVDQLCFPLTLTQEVGHHPSVFHFGGFVQEEAL
jgi:hypothetical protein